MTAIARSTSEYSCPGGVAKLFCVAMCCCLSGDDTSELTQFWFLRVVLVIRLRFPQSTHLHASHVVLVYYHPVARDMHELAGEPIP